SQSPAPAERAATTIEPNAAGRFPKMRSATPSTRWIADVARRTAPRLRVQRAASRARSKIASPRFRSARYAPARDASGGRMVRPPIPSRRAARIAIPRAITPSDRCVMTVLLLYDPYESKLLLSKDTLRHEHPSRGLRKQLALDVQAELRRLTTEIDGLDERASRHFGVNRTDLRCLDVLTSTRPMR